jgi:hypothetical protein
VQVSVFIWGMNDFKIVEELLKTGSYERKIRSWWSIFWTGDTVFQIQIALGKNVEFVSDGALAMAGKKNGVVEGGARTPKWENLKD